jgi:hypothetical protein
MTGVDCVSTAGGKKKYKTEGDGISEKCKARALDPERRAWIGQGEWAQIQGEWAPIDLEHHHL